MQREGAIANWEYFKSEITKMFMPIGRTQKARLMLD